MKDEKLPKRCETKKHGSCGKREIPQLRWADCVKRDLRKAEGKKSGVRKGQQQGAMGDNESSRKAD